MQMVVVTVLLIASLVWNTALRNNNVLLMEKNAQLSKELSDLNATIAEGLCLPRLP